jgi:hypothetical protein
MFNIFDYLKSFFTKNTVEILGKRSSKWATVRKKHLEINGTCAACGGVKDLSVHHCVPVHLDESKELDPNNLITLCEHNNCHFTFGHLYSWFSHNTNVKEDAAKWLEKVKNRPQKLN